MADIKSIAAFIPEYRININDLYEQYHTMSWTDYRTALRMLKRMVNKFRRRSVDSLRWIYEQRLQLREKIVPGPNEDALTAGVRSLDYALQRSGVSPRKIDGLFVVSESFPYAVGSSTKIAGKLGLTNLKYGSRGEFACKPFGEFIDIASALIDSGRANHIAITATDASQGAPGDDLEFSASYYASSVIIGPEDEGIAKIKGRTSLNYDFSDFIRKENVSHPEHEGAGTSLAFRGMILSALKQHLKQFKIPTRSLLDKTYIIHAPNGSFPNEALKDISEEFDVPLARKVFDENGKLSHIQPEVKISNLASLIANGYSATVPTALCDTIERGKLFDDLLAIFYGSGAGSDIISVEITADEKELARNIALAPTVQEQIDHKIMIGVKDYFNLRDHPDRKAKNIAIFRLDPVGKCYYRVEGCPNCHAVYFGDSWSRINFPKFEPPKKFAELKNKCIRGIEKELGEAKRICGTKLRKIKVPKYGTIIKIEKFLENKKHSQQATDPYWVMFEKHMVRGFNFDAKLNQFNVGDDVEAIIGRWRPDPKSSVPYIYVPMYQKKNKS